MSQTLHFPEAHELPPPREVTPAEVTAALAADRRLVVLDDDPTGTQTVADVPVLTTWTVEDLRWALRQDSTAFFVLTNTRSLAPDAAAARNREVVRALAQASAAEGIGYVLASRSDSTLRGHFPLETDVLADEVPVDGVVLVPAYIEAGRLTADSVHWMRTAEGMLPVGQSEFARDATFGYANSRLPEWIEEKTGGRVAAADVLRITLEDLRVRGPQHVAGLLGSLREGRTAVADALTDDDLRVLALASATAEATGTRLLYRCGPSFVRARAGQAARAPLTAEELRAGRDAAAPAGQGHGHGHVQGHGLIAVGSHVGLTTRQLDRLRERGGIAEFELDVHALLDEERRAAHISEVARACARALEESEVVVRTTRSLVTGADADDSLAIARNVSAALVETVRAITAERRPAFVVAKGGITSSDIATEGLEIRRAWARGTLLPGIVSLWEPESGPSVGIPYIVFAGNVGDDNALADAIDLLRSR
ncbi:four-carbon acid sugar kinase family protein [Streptomyces sp. FXJ1.4098]|nr:four-carbon acid sugar kinase family protein [Streptomyces sp. FXJ1.4098]